jgi:3-deoxy-D-arabino-heptulosonate 7-phosphate (DAHP) synthase class II
MDKDLRMNANKLADEVEMWGKDLLALNMKGGIPVIEGAKMLRQQAKELDEAGGMIGVLREYISDLENGLDSSIKLNKAQAERQVKELTDEEIAEVFDNTFKVRDFEDAFLKFAKAILRKAQEK